MTLYEELIALFDECAEEQTAYCQKCREFVYAFRNQLSSYLGAPSELPQKYSPAVGTRNVVYDEASKGVLPAEDSDRVWEVRAECIDSDRFVYFGIKINLWKSDFHFYLPWFYGKFRVNEDSVELRYPWSDKAYKMKIGSPIDPAAFEEVVSHLREFLQRSTSPRDLQQVFPMGFAITND